MIETCLFNLQLILQDFFTAFGLFTILYLLLSIVIKNSTLIKINEQSNRFISLIGILYLIVWFLSLWAEFTLINQEEKTELLNRMFGEYWFGFWIQPVLWFLISQLFRLQTVQKSVVLRIVFSFFMIFSIERLVIFITSIHRDYLPSSWTMSRDLGIYPSNFILSIVVKILFYVLFVGVFYWLSLKIKLLFAKWQIIKK
jgi:hypothetical protein